MHATSDTLSARFLALLEARVARRTVCAHRAARGGKTSPFTKYVSARLFSDPETRTPSNATLLGFLHCAGATPGEDVNSSAKCT
jgi:hypothetical protein